MATDYFNPSDVARLVLGYLKDVNCFNTYKSFREECKELEEHNILASRRGRDFTVVNGKSLFDILDHYVDLIKNASDSGVRKTLKVTIDHINGSSNQPKITITPVSQQSEHLASSGSVPHSRCKAKTSAYTVRRNCLHTRKVASQVRENEESSQRHENFGSPSIGTPRSHMRDLFDGSDNTASSTTNLTPQPAKLVPGTSLQSQGSHYDDSSYGFINRARSQTDIRSPFSVPMYSPATPAPCSPANTFAAVARGVLPQRDESMEPYSVPAQSPHTPEPLPSHQQSPDLLTSYDTAAKEPKQGAPALLTSHPSSAVNPPSHASPSIHRAQVLPITSPAVSSTHVGHGCDSEHTATEIPVCNNVPGTSTDHLAAQTPVKQSSTYVEGHMSFTTPMKTSEIGDKEDLLKTPRRKRVPPKRKTGGESTGSSNNNSNEPYVTHVEPLSIPQEFQQLLNNLEFAEKLAEKINKVKNKGENSGEEKLPEMSTQGPSEDKPDGCSPPHQVEPPIVHDIDTNFPFVSRQESLADDALRDIIDMTRHDPEFDALFNIFNTDKVEFIQQEYGTQAAALGINLHGDVSAGKDVNSSAPSESETPSSCVQQNSSLYAMVPSITNAVPGSILPHGSSVVLSDTSTLATVPSSHCTTVVFSNATVPATMSYGTSVPPNDTCVVQSTTSNFRGPDDVVLHSSVGSANYLSSPCGRTCSSSSSDNYPVIHAVSMPAAGSVLQLPDAPGTIQLVHPAVSADGTLTTGIVQNIRILSIENPQQKQSKITIHQNKMTTKQTETVTKQTKTVTKKKTPTRQTKSPTKQSKMSTSVTEHYTCPSPIPGCSSKPDSPKKPKTASKSKKRRKVTLSRAPSARVTRSSSKKQAEAVRAALPCDVTDENKTKSEGKEEPRSTPECLDCNRNIANLVTYASMKNLPRIAPRPAPGTSIKPLHSQNLNPHVVLERNLVASSDGSVILVSPASLGVTESAGPSMPTQTAPCIQFSQSVMSSQPQAGATVSSQLTSCASQESSAPQSSKTAPLPATPVKFQTINASQLMDCIDIEAIMHTHYSEPEQEASTSKNKNTPKKSRPSHSQKSKNKQRKNSKNAIDVADKDEHEHVDRQRSVQTNGTKVPVPDNCVVNRTAQGGQAHTSNQPNSPEGMVNLTQAEHMESVKEDDIIVVTDSSDAAQAINKRPASRSSQSADATASTSGASQQEQRIQGGTRSPSDSNHSLFQSQDTFNDSLLALSQTPRDADKQKALPETPGQRKPSQFSGSSISPITKSATSPAALPNDEDDRAAALLESEMGHGDPQQDIVPNASQPPYFGMQQNVNKIGSIAHVLSRTISSPDMIPINGNLVGQLSRTVSSPDLISAASPCPADINYPYTPSPYSGDERGSRSACSGKKDRRRIRPTLLSKNETEPRLPFPACNTYIESEKDAEYPENQTGIGCFSYLPFIENLTNQMKPGFLPNQVIMGVLSNQTGSSNLTNQAGMANQASIGVPTNQTSSSNPTNQASMVVPTNQTSGSNPTNQASMVVPTNQTSSNPTNQASMVVPTNQASGSNLTNQPSMVVPTNQSSSSIVTNQASMGVLPKHTGSSSFANIDHLPNHVITGSQAIVVSDKPGRSQSTDSELQSTKAHNSDVSVPATDQTDNAPVDHGAQNTGAKVISAVDAMKDSNPAATSSPRPSEQTKSVQPTPDKTPASKLDIYCGDSSQSYQSAVHSPWQAGLQAGSVQFEQPAQSPASRSVPTDSQSQDGKFSKQPNTADQEHVKSTDEDTSGGTTSAGPGQGDHTVASSIEFTPHSGTQVNEYDSAIKTKNLQMTDSKTDDRTSTADEKRLLGKMKDRKKYKKSKRHKPQMTESSKTPAARSDVRLMFLSVIQSEYGQYVTDSSETPVSQNSRKRKHVSFSDNNDYSQPGTSVLTNGEPPVKKSKGVLKHNKNAVDHSFRKTTGSPVKPALQSPKHQLVKSQRPSGSLKSPSGSLKSPYKSPLKSPSEPQSSTAAQQKKKKQHKPSSSKAEDISARKEKKHVKSGLSAASHTPQPSKEYKVTKKLKLNNATDEKT